MKSFIRRLTTLTALTATALGASAIASTSALAQNYGEQAIAANRAVAVAEPVANGRFYRLLIIEQLSDRRACYEEQPGSPTVIDPLLLNFDFSGICGRSSDSNGYSVRIGNEDLSRQYRLQITRRGDNLVLVALPGALPGRGGDLPVLEIGRSSGVANDFVKLELDPGWQFSSRTLNGQDQSHIYLSNSQDLDTVVAQAQNRAPSRPSTPAPSTPVPSTPSPSGPPILSGGSLPAPGSVGVPATPRPSTPSPGASNSIYKVIVPSDSALVRLRVRQVASDAFATTLDGDRVIQAGLFQERSRADQLVAQLSSAGLSSRVIESEGSAVPAVSTPVASPSSAVFYQVVVPESGSNTRDRVNEIESGAFRTRVNGESVIQAGRFRERDRAEQLQRRLSAARLPARIIEVSAPVASVPPASTNPSNNIPRARQGQLTVVIDPGHGGRDPGAVGIGGLREKDINITVSRRIQASLQAAGINAVMTRSDDRELDLQPRVNIAERADADIFVSIHSNAISMSRPDVNGLETYYYSSGFRLAQTIQNNILQRTDLRDRGVRRARFYVLVNTSMPAVLVETGFVTGSQDAARFRNPQAVNTIADGITAGILQYLNVSQ